MQKLNSSEYFGNSVVLRIRFHSNVIVIVIIHKDKAHSMDVRGVTLGVGSYLQTLILSFPDYAFTWDLTQAGIALGRDNTEDILHLLWVPRKTLKKATDRLKTQKWSDDDDDDPSIDQG